MINDLNYWRMTGLPPRFLIFDARVALTIPVLFLRLHWKTLLAVLAVWIFFWMIERRGYSFEVFLRLARTWLYQRLTGQRFPLIVHVTHDNPNYRAESQL